MEDFIFHETEPGEIRTFDFEPSLFHNPLHLSIQSPSGWKWFYVLHPRHKRVIASLYLHVQGDTASSSVQSPFGTVECSDDLAPNTLYHFLEFIERRLHQNGIRRIVLKCPPVHFYPKYEGLLQTFLFNLGYVVTDAKMGTVRRVADDFTTELNRLERRKLRKAHHAALSCRFISNDRQKEVYDFILSCRERKGYPLSMTFTDFERTVQAFPDRYILTGVYFQEQLISASVAVRVNTGILYNFYADHDSKYDSLSPVVLLVEMLYNYCREHNIVLLDYGTSATHGKPNFGLLTFKLRLGGTPSPKHTFEKQLNP